MKHTIKLLLATASVALLAACGGGGGGSVGDTSNNPLAKYAGTYYSCVGNMKNTVTVAATGSNAISYSLVEETHQNNNCSGPIVETNRSPLATATFLNQTTANLPSYSIFPNSGSADRVSISVPGVTEQYTGAFYLAGNYVVAFDLENGVLVSNEIYSKESSFNYNSLIQSGGGGSTSAPVVQTYDLRAAYVAMFTTPSSNQFFISGTIEAVTISGSGTATSSAVTSGTFEGLPSLQRSQIITGTLISNGPPTPLSVVSTDWTDSNYVPRGSTGEDVEYEVVVGTPTIPTAARVNDVGTLFTANWFQDSTKRVLMGTVVATYVVEPNGSTSAIVKFIRTYRDTSSTITDIATATYGIGTSNRFTRVSETLVSPLDQINLTLRYR